MTITFTPINQPSSSKGWSRIKAVDADGKPVIQSRTGNVWVSAPHSAEIKPDTVITVTAQKMLRTRKGREEVYTSTYRVVAEDGAACTPGATMITSGVNGVMTTSLNDSDSLVTITGARMAERTH